MGDVMTVRQLLEGMLILSGADTTYAAARITGTSLQDAGAPEDDPVAAFIEAMNGLTKTLKLKNTHFMNPVGIDQEDHYSSARDLARLAQEASCKTGSGRDRRSVVGSDGDRGTQPAGSHPRQHE